MVSMETKDLTEEQRVYLSLADKLDAGDPETCMRFSDLELHARLLADRGITAQELAEELGMSAETVYRYLRVGGRRPLRDRVDDAITAIWEREHGWYPKGELDPELLEILEDIRIRDLMGSEVPHRRAGARWASNGGMFGNQDPSFDNVERAIEDARPEEER